MAFLLVMKAEIVRQWIMMRRYWFATLVGIIMGYGMLMMMVYMFLTNEEEATKWALKSLDNILGVILGMYAFGTVGMFSRGLQSMTNTGHLEQLCMSPHGLVTNFLARSFVSTVSSMMSCGVMLYMVALTLGESLQFDPLATFVVLALTYLNLIGFGFMIGGLILVFKQIGQVAQLLRLVIFALPILATEKSEEWSALLKWAAHSFPVWDAAICLKYVLIEGQGMIIPDTPDVQGTFVSVFRHSSFSLMLVSCAFWLSAGIMLFKMMENHSRDKGTLGTH